MIRFERRLKQPRWLSVAVPIGSLVLAFALIAVLLLATGHSPLHVYSRLFHTAFVGRNNIEQTFVAATPLLFTGLCAAVAFRVRLFNIGGEGQLYVGAVAGAGIAIALAGSSSLITVPAMILVGGAAGAGLALIAGALKAFFNTSEIITSLMLNYIAYWAMYYLIFDSNSYWRDTSPEAATFPTGKFLPDAATWPLIHIGSLAVPFGFVLGVGIAVVVWFLYSRTRFGFEAEVIGDSPRAARYAGMRTRRKILAVMALSGAIAGVGGASQDGDFRHVLDPKGLSASGYGYSGIVVAALARYNPFGVCLIAFLLGGLQNAGYALQDVTFPQGLVGVMEGIILFCALGCEVFVRYRVRFRRPGAQKATEVAA